MTQVAALTLALFVLPSVPSSLSAQEDVWPRRVLITNDDGIEDEGLIALARAFAAVAETYVVAPLESVTGSTSYVSAIARRSLEVERRSLGDGIVAYGVDGFPADAVALALYGLMADDPPDLVISGVNGGPNLAGDWNFSGTIGAPRMAAFFGVPAIAVSGYSADDPAALPAIAGWIVELSRSRIVRELEPGQYLTVSIPRQPVGEILGAEIVRRGQATWTPMFERSDESGTAGREVWQWGFARRRVSPLEGTDLAAYQGNRIAVVPMRVDEHDYALLNRLLQSGTVLPSWPAHQSER